MNSRKWFSVNGCNMTNAMAFDGSEDEFTKM